MNCIKCNKETGADWKTLCITCWINRTPDEIRAQRQEKLDRKIARLRSKASRLDSIGKEKTSALDPFHGDIAFFTQPNMNTSRGRSFKNFRERLFRKFDDGCKMQNEASELNEKADRLEKQGAVVKGDAEKRWQAKRDAMDKIVSVGTKVSYPLFAQPLGTVIKVNKKTYTVKFDHGPQYAVEKAFIQLVR